MPTISMAIALMLLAVPLRAQEPNQSLEQLRTDRMKQALELNDEQAAAVAQAMAEVHRVTREAHAREQQSFERLRTALSSASVDQDVVRAELQAIEREREVIASVRREQARRLEQRLTPEQQAKLLLFNRQFDERLRQLVSQRRGGHGQGHRGRPGHDARVPRPGRERPDGVDQRVPPRQGASRSAADEIARLRQRITLLEQRIAQLQSQE
jgi:Spy/CpxP family protein refolding chaperone